MSMYALGGRYQAKIRNGAPRTDLTSKHKASKDDSKLNSTPNEPLPLH